MKKWFAVCLALGIGTSMLASCGGGKEKIVIYTSAEDYRIEYLQSRLDEEFPQYKIILEYMSTGNHAAKLKAEGKNTECDISHSLEYVYLDQLSEAGILADLSGYDRSMYTDDVNLSDDYIIELRNSGAIIVNPEVLEKKNLPEPASYEDLLKPEYRGKGEGLISMPNPKSSGSGYMFLKSLVNAWGEEEAFGYFDELTKNVQSYTSSGSGPVNKLLQGEVAIGLGMTAQAVTQINDGANLKILFFEEGAPYSLYGNAIIAGKETRACVKEVFDFITGEYNIENNQKFFPEKIYKDLDFTIENYPADIRYADMSNNTLAEKSGLLEKWKY